MIAIEEFAPEHAAAIELQAMQAGERGEGCDYAAGGPAWTVRDGNGRIIGCLGFIKVAPSYAVAWALLAENKRNSLVALTRVARRVIEGAGWRRIELHTRADFEAAMIWAEMLGFEIESVKRKAATDGGDVLVWVRLRED